MKSAKEWADTIPGHFEGDHHWELANWIAAIQADALEAAAVECEKQRDYWPPLVSTNPKKACEECADAIRKLKPEAGK